MKEHPDDPTAFRVILSNWSTRITKLLLSSNHHVESTIVERNRPTSMRNAIIGPTMLGIGTILVSSMFSVLKSLDNIDPMVRASWRLQSTFLALLVPSAVSIYLNFKGRIVPPPMATVWSGCGYALYNVGLCTALAKTSLLRASILSQCAPLFIILYKIFHNKFYGARKPENGGCQVGGVHWKHMLGVVLTLVGTGLFISSTTESNDLDTLKTEQNQEATQGLIFESCAVGDVAAMAASIGYAAYISCGQQARRSVPVYVHLPGCVLVATFLVCAVCFATIDVTPILSWKPSNSREDMAPETGRIDHFGVETGDFCSDLLGWICSKHLPRVAYLGIVCGAIAVGLINWSLNHVSALQAATANSAEPIAASIIGIILFSEPFPSFVAIAAAGIIVLAMMLCSSDDESKCSNVDGSNKKIESPEKAESKCKVTTYGTIPHLLRV